MADSTGMADIRKTNYDRIVKGFALQQYRMKQLCMIQSSNSWTENYYKETAADLTGQSGNSIKGVPRLAKFPYGEVTWTLTGAPNVKHAFEGIISWEDSHTNNIPVIARTLLRIARGVTKSVDTVIAEGVVALAGNTVAAIATWDNVVVASQNPIQDILNAKAQIEVDNYDPNSNGFLIMNPLDYAKLLGNASIRNAGQFYTDSVTKNGVVGNALGLTWVSSNSVLEHGVQVVIAKESMTWKSVVGLTVKTINDAGIKDTIRAFEVGQLQVTNPDAICKITGV